MLLKHGGVQNLLFRRETSENKGLIFSIPIVKFIQSHWILSRKIPVKAPEAWHHKERKNIPFHNNYLKVCWFINTLASLQPSAHHRTSLMARNHRVTNSILSHKPTEAIDKKSASSQNYQESEILLFLLIIIETWLLMQFVISVLPSDSDIWFGLFCS